MSTPNGKQSHTRKRKHTIAATYAATIDGSRAASGANEKARRNLTLASNGKATFRGNERRSRSAGAAGDPVVLDNLPETVPVGVSELNVIETYLGNIIDGLLTGTAAGPLGTPSSTTITNPRKPSRASRTRP